MSDVWSHGNQSCFCMHSGGYGRKGSGSKSQSNVKLFVVMAGRSRLGVGPANPKGSGRQEKPQSVCRSNRSRASRGVAARGVTPPPTTTFHRRAQRQRYLGSWKRQGLREPSENSALVAALRGWTRRMPFRRDQPHHSLFNV